MTFVYRMIYRWNITRKSINQQVPPRMKKEKNEQTKRITKTKMKKKRRNQ